MLATNVLWRSRRYLPASREQSRSHNPEGADLLKKIISKLNSGSLEQEYSAVPRATESVAYSRT